MHIDKLQQSINAYLIPNDPGYFGHPSPITLKTYGTDGIVATSEIRDDCNECLRLYVSGGAHGHYIISDHGYAHTAALMIDGDFSADQGADTLIANYLAIPKYAGLERAGEQVICSATEVDFPEKLTLFFRLLQDINDEIQDTNHAHELHDDQNPYDAQEWSAPDLEPDFDAIWFWHHGRSYTGSELIDELPRNPQLQSAYRRYSDALLDNMLEGMSPYHARQRAQAVIDGEWLSPTPSP